MTAWENPLLAIFTVLVIVYGCYLLVLFFRSVLRNWRAYLSIGGILAAAAAGIFIIGALLAGGVLFAQYYQEQATLKKCLTAHDRRAYANAAPDDYFGRQLRQEAETEAKTCAELAAKKEAEAAKVSARPRP